MRGFLRTTLSAHMPANSFRIDEVASATPSMIPIAAGPAPRVAVRKSGRMGYVISLATSARRLTKPSATTVCGSLRESAIHGLPIDYLEPGVDVFRAGCLEIQVVGVLVNV